MKVYKYVHMKINFLFQNKMPPKKCSCKRHAQYSDEDSAIVKPEPKKKIKKAIINALVSRGDINGHSKYICNHYGCLKQGEAYIVENVNETAECDTTPQVSEIGQIKEGDMCGLARAIGESLTKDIMKDITGCATSYKDPDYLQNFSPEGGY